MFKYGRRFYPLLTLAIVASILCGATTPAQAEEGLADTCDAAIPITLPYDEAGLSITSAGDHDWYTFSISERSMVFMETFSDSESRDTDLTLYGGCAKGKPEDLRAFNDDKVDDATSLAFACLEPGTYYLEVGGFADTATPDDFGLHVTAEPGGNCYSEMGEHNNAPYSIMVPPAWNGVLLVFAHGLVTSRDMFGNPTLLPTPPLANGGAALELLDRGYALAGSSYAENGPAIDVAIRNIHALTTYFNGVVGKPDTRIVSGCSMGGQVASALIEKYPGIYDAAIPIGCSMSGPQGKHDILGAYRLAYHVAFGFPEEWGTYYDVNDSLVWGQVFPVPFVPQMSDPANWGLWEFMRLVTGTSNHMYTMWFATHLAAEFESTVGGPLASFEYVYDLQEDEIAYLASLGVDAEDLLAQMNELAENTPEPRKSVLNRLYNLYGRLSGDITGPVLRLANIQDFIAESYQETRYRELVEAAGNEDLLVQLFHTRGLHCGIETDSMAAAVEYVMDWLEAGEPPDLDSWEDPATGMSFADLGFDLDFVSAPWPLVPRTD